MLGATKNLGIAVLIFSSPAISAGIYAGAGLGSDTVDFSQRTHARGTTYQNYPP